MPTGSNLKLRSSCSKNLSRIQNVVRIYFLMLTRQTIDSLIVLLALRLLKHLPRIENVVGIKNILQLF